MKIVDIKPEQQIKVYSEVYFGVGLGITSISDCVVIILPFVMIMLSKETVYR